MKILNHCNSCILLIHNFCSASAKIMFNLMTSANPSTLSRVDLYRRSIPSSKEENLCHPWFGVQLFLSILNQTIHELCFSDKCFIHKRLFAPKMKVFLHMPTENPKLWRHLKAGSQFPSFARYIH